MEDRSWQLISSISEVEENRYTSFLEQSSTATIYHQPGWLQAVESSLDKEAAHIIIYKGDDPVGVLPGFLSKINETPITRLVSMNPGRGGPALVGSWKSNLECIMSGVNSISGKLIVSHTIRSDVPEHLSLNGFLTEYGYRSSLGGKFVLSLEKSWDTILDNMHKDRRYNIRKGHDLDYEIQELDPKKEIDDFYADYVEKLKELDSDPHPRSFFEILFEELADKVELITNVVDGERRGYHLYLLDDYQDRIRHYMMTVTDEDYKYHSGELLHEYMIRRGIDEGWSSYDFGGHDVDFRDGGFKYKQQFGGSLEPEFRWETEFSRGFSAARKLARYIRDR